MSATYAQLPQPDDDTIGSPEPHTAAPDSPTIPPARSSRPIADQAIPPPIALAPLGASSSAAPAALPPAAPSYAPLDQASLILAQQRRREQVKRLVVFSLAAFAAALLLYRMRDPSTDASSPPSGDSSSPSFAPPKIRLPHLASYVASLADGHRDPCRDFYEFSCASWLKEVGTVPVEWGVLNQAMGAIAYINMLTTQYLLDLVQVSPSPAPSATLPESASAVEVARQNVLTPLWVSCIDTETQEKRGFTYLHELFTAYEPSQFHDSASFIEAAATHMNSPPFWELEIGVLSEYNATRKLLALQATGLNDDFTGYYMDVPGLRDQYTEYVRSMLKRVGGHSSEAADVVAFEYAIAGMDLSFAEQFIEGADAIRALQPSWNWTRLMELAYIDLERMPSFTVFTDAAEYFPQLDALIQSYIDDGKQRALTAYLQYHMYISIGSVMAPSLQPDPLGFSDVSTKRKEQASWVQQLVDAHVLRPHRATPRQLRRVRETAPKSRLPLFRFLGHAKRYLSDYAATKHDPAAEQAEWRFFEEKMLLAKPDVSAAMRKPWSQASPKRFCQLIAGLFQQDTVGKLYVDYTWRDETEPAVRSTIGRIRSGLHATIEAANWMDEPTKQAALDKLEKLQQRIGAPKVADYRDIQLDKRKYLENLVDMSRRDWIERVESLYVPVNRSAWMEAPQGEVAIVNAFYVPTLNEAFLPAGLIQRKMFDESFPEAYNLGGYGMVAGHELGHAFDDSGRQFDAVGSVRDWWSDESEAAFSERASCFEQEYSQFNVGGTYLNGSFVLNENLGDATGVTVAFNAMGAQTGGTGVTLPQFGELSPQQLFFVSYGQNWCEAVNPLYQQRLFEAQVDPHSPGFARVLGVLRNSAAFQEAFQCPAGSPMNPASKCTLW